MLWNEFVKLSRISKLPLNEQVRKFNEYTLDEENLHHSTKNVIGGPLFIPITITNSSPNGAGIITNLFINGVLNQTQTDIGSKTVRVDVSSRFFISIPSNPGYDQVEYRLRNNGVSIYYNNSDSGGFPIISPTFTVAPGGNYVFTCNGYST